MTVASARTAFAAIAIVAAFAGCNAILGLDEVERLADAAAGSGGLGGEATTASSSSNGGSDEGGSGGAGGEILHAGDCADPIPLPVPGVVQGDTARAPAVV